MNLLDMVKRNVIGMQEDDMEDDDRYEESYEERSFPEHRRSSFDQYENRSRSGYSISEKGKIIDLPNELADMKVAVKKPTRYEDVIEVCDKLKAFSPVIVNLEQLDQKEAQRVVDFIGGACYTMDGHFVTIKPDVFLVTPSMVNIDKEKELDDAGAKSNSFFSRFMF